MLGFVVGVDGCRGGWVATRYELATRDIQIATHGTFDEVLRLYRNATCIAVDIPIGLHENGQARSCDLAARKALGRTRGSSVFPAPDRRLLGSLTYLETLLLSHRLIGKGISKQGFAIIPKIEEVDRILTADRQRQVIEVHPEVCFWALAGGKPMTNRKAKRAGFDERRELLSGAFNEIHIPSWDEARSIARPAKPDDVLDAIVASWSAVRFAEGCSGQFPSDLEYDARGLRMNITY